jgi:uncharacterized protein YaiL (DUF2058 family)
MQNLRDKLLKAGLVSKEQTEKVAEEPKPSRAAPRRDERPPAREHREHREHRGPPREHHRAPPPRTESSIPKLPPLPGSKAHQRIEARKQRELDDKLRDLVQNNQIPTEPGASTFYFVTRKGRLRRLEVSEAQAKQLEEGKLAVVERQEPAQIEHSLVLPEIAEKMLALFPKSVRFLNKPGAAVGFLTDEALKDAQEKEASAPPEVPEPQAAPEADDEGPEASEAAPEEKPASGSDTWISIKRSPTT